MKKFTLIFIILLAFAGFSRAQVIENFEHIPLNYMLAATNDSSSMMVVANPDPSGINTSASVVRFLRDKDGVSWNGFWSNLPTVVDVTTNKYVHVKVWKPRISPIKFKLEGGAAGTLESASMNPQATTGAWEDIVFDFSSKTGTYPIIAFMPDFEDPITLTEDIVIYFDDIMVNNDPTPASASAYVIEDFETITLNIMLNGADDLSTMEVVPNPDPTGINTSGSVLKFMRDKDGQPWGGFWSALPAAVDVTTNQYVHVKVWKPRISPVKFKLEGGAAGTSERYSKYPQITTGAWEDIVIDFKDKTGTYPVIAFMPDFIEPVGLADDIVIYFDDIRITNSPTPESQVVFNVDMHGVPLVAADTLFIAGDFGGTNVWIQPGLNLNNILTDADGDSIYSINMNLADSTTYPFKFFKNRGWDGGEWTGDPNRKVVVTGSRSFNFMWGVKTYNVTFNVDMHGSGLTAGQPVYVAGDFGGDNGSWNMPGDNPLNEMIYTGADSIYTINLVLDTLTYHFKFFKGAGWDGGEWTGDPNRQIMIEGDYTANFLWGKNGQLGINENPLANKVSAYPVPFTNTLTINTLVDVKTVIISSSYGRQVARFDNLATGRTTINTSDLASGMYFITFYGMTGGQFTQKLIK